ncbi:glycosyltransferase [Priestia flexa]|uniref:glycosyltransferase n=1 Tax=Priestia flexa TaxID=86664 RepID=UPI003FD06583
MITFLIVLYNEICDNSMSLKSLSESILVSEKKANIIIFDNSDKVDIIMENKEYCEMNNILYQGCGRNMGLSRAYNNVIKENNLQWICLLDQDTDIPSNFVQLAYESTENNPKVMLHIPWVVSNNKIISPAIIKGIKVTLLKSKRKKPIKYLTAINSGMIIHKSVYEKIGYYDENLFLDSVDHNFMRKFKREYKNYCIVDSELQQDFSEFSNSLEGSLNRFKIFKSDYKYFCSTSIYGKVYYFIHIIYKVIKLSLRFQTFKFFKLLFK